MKGEKTTVKGKEFYKHNMQHLSHEKIRTQGVALYDSRGKMQKGKMFNAPLPEKFSKCAY